MIDVDDLAQEIRRIDGNHDKGACAIAEALLPWIEKQIEPKKCQGLPDARCDYLSTCGAPCNKCGRVHNPLSFEIYTPAQKRIPEGFEVRRNPDGDIIVTRLKDAASAAYWKDAPIIPIVMGWHFLDALLSSDESECPENDTCTDQGCPWHYAMDPTEGDE